MTTTVKVISPILVDGVWKSAGEDVDMPDDQAKVLESSGMVDLVSVDGHPVVWGSCCTDHS